MALPHLIQNLPNELQNKIFYQSFEGSANRVFKEFLQENDLFRYNFNLHYMRHDYNYTLFSFIRDCNMLKRQHTFLDDIIFNVEEFLEYVIANHVFEPSDDDSDSDQSDATQSDDDSI